MKIFSLPIFKDSEKMQKTKVFYKLMIGSALIVTFLEILECISLPENLIRWISIIAIYNLVALALIYIAKKGFVQTASYIFIIFLFAIIFGLAWTAGGINSSAIQDLSVAVLVAGLLLGWKKGLFVAIAAILLSFILLILGNFAILPPNAVIHTAITQWLNLSLRIVLIGILQYLIITSLDNALSNSKQELKLRKESESRIQSISKNFTDGMIYQIRVFPDGKRKFTFLSDSVKKLYGIWPEDALRDANLIYSRVYKDDIHAFIKAENIAIKSMSVFKTEIRMVKPNGEIRWSYMVSTPKMLDDGSICWDGIEFDISERKQYEEELNKTAEQFRLLAENSTDMISRHTPDGVYIYVSPACETILGYTPEELISHSVFKFIHPEDLGKIESSRKTVEDNPLVDIVNFRIRCKDGRYIWLEWTSHSIKDKKQGTIVEIQVASRDITERKTNEEALRKSEKLYHGLYDNANIAIFQSTLEGQIISVNNEFAHMFGYANPQEFLNTVKNASDIFANPTRRTEIIELKKENPDLNTFENQYVKKDGDLLIGKLNIRLVEDSDSCSNFFEGFIEDITERKKAEEDLLTITARLETLIQVSPLAITLLDKNNNVQLWNNAAHNIFGWHIDEIRGKQNPIIPELNREEYNKLTQDILRGNSIINHEALRRKKDGTLITVSISSSPVFDPFGDIMGRMAIIADISEKKKAEMELADRNRFIESIVNITPDILYIFDIVDRTYIYSNNGIHKVLGYTIEEVNSMGNQLIPTLMHTDDFNVYIQDIVPKYTHLQDQEILKHQYRMKHKTGAWRWLISSEIIYQHQSDGSPQQIFGIVHDISEIKQIENSLRKSEHFFKESQRAANVGSYNLSFETGFWESSEVLDQIFGIDNNYIRNVEGWLEIVHPEDREMMDKYFREEVFGQHKRFDKEYRIIRKSDEVGRWLYGLGDLYFDEQGKLLALMGTIQDITLRKTMEAEKIESESTFADMFQKSPVSIALINALDGIIIDVNETFLKDLEYTKDEVVGHSTEELGIFNNLNDRQNLQDMMIKDGMALGYECSFRTKSGKTLIGLVSIVIIKYKGRRIQLSTVIDITNRKKSEEKLKEHMEELVAWHRLTVGREGRVMELKNEVNELLAKIGRPLRYGTTEI